MGSGEIENQILVGVVFAFSGIVALTDLIFGKIHNWLTFPLLVTGLFFSTWFGSWAGLGQSILGVSFGFLVYAWIFWRGAMGGGDVKFLMALGAWGGFHFVLEVALMGILVGGAMSFLILLVKGRLFQFIHKIYRFFLTLVVRELDLEKPKIDRTMTMPFGVPLAVAAIWVVLNHPLDKIMDGMGFHIWG